MEWLTRSSPKEDITNIDWLIDVLPDNKKDDGKPEPDIKSQHQLLKALKYLLGRILNLKGSLVISPSHWKDVLKELYTGKIHNEWKDR